MRRFGYSQPDCVAGVLAQLGTDGGGARLLAGGQSLNMALKDRSIGPSNVISLRRVPELRGIVYGEDGTLHVGAGTTYAELAGASLPGWHGELCRVAGNLADRSVRNIATVGGGACQAEPRYDMPALLVGAGATLRLVSQRGERLVPASAFFSDEGGTCLHPAELMTTLIFPAAYDRVGASTISVALEKFRYRAFEAAILIAVCALSLDAAGVAVSARLTVGAVGKAPLGAPVAAASIVGRRLSDISLDTLGAAVSGELLPEERQTNRQRQYQAELVKTLTARSVARAFTQSRTELADA